MGKKPHVFLRAFCGMFEKGGMGKNVQYTVEAWLQTQYKTGVDDLTISDQFGKCQPSNFQETFFCFNLLWSEHISHSIMVKEK